MGDLKQMLSQLLQIQSRQVHPNQPVTLPPPPGFTPFPNTPYFTPAAPPPFPHGPTPVAPVARPPSPHINPFFAPPPRQPTPAPSIAPSQSPSDSDSVSGSKKTDKLQLKIVDALINKLPKLNGGGSPESFLDFLEKVDDIIKFGDGNVTDFQVLYIVRMSATGSAQNFMQSLWRDPATTPQTWFDTLDRVTGITTLGLRSLLLAE